MTSDPLLLCLLGFALLLLGGLLTVAVRPLGRGLDRLWSGFLRLSRIDADAGKPSAAEEQIMALVDKGEEKGAIEQSEKELIENVFAFNNITAEDVMVHRTDMVMVWAEDTDGEIVETIESSGLSRFPVCGEDADDVLGVLSTRDYLLNARKEKPKPLKELLRGAYFVPESVQADVLFRDMQSKKVHMALVVDEYGGTSGLVTMEDLLEEIVGNIYDEFDPQEDQEIVQLEENLWRVAGAAELEDLYKALGLEAPSDQEYDTLGGLVFDQLSVIPEDGSRFSVEAGGLRVQVESVRDRRVEWALVSRLGAPGEEPRQQ